MASVTYIEDLDFLVLLLLVEILDFLALLLRFRSHRRVVTLMLF